MVTGLTKSPDAMPTVRGTEVAVTLTADGRILGLIPMPNDGDVTKTVHARLEDPTSSGTCS